MPGDSRGVGVMFFFEKIHFKCSVACTYTVIFSRVRSQAEEALFLISFQLGQNGTFSQKLYGYEQISARQFQNRIVVRERIKSP